MRLPSLAAHSRLLAQALAAPIHQRRVLAAIVHCRHPPRPESDAMRRSAPGALTGAFGDLRHARQQGIERVLEHVRRLEKVRACRLGHEAASPQARSSQRAAPNGVGCRL